MARYSIEPRDRISVKRYPSLIFDIGANMSKNLRGEYSVGTLAAGQKLLDNAKQSAMDPLKTASKRAIQKAAESIAALISNKITNKITRN